MEWRHEKGPAPDLGHVVSEKGNIIFFFLIYRKGQYNIKGQYKHGLVCLFVVVV